MKDLRAISKIRFRAPVGAWMLFCLLVPFLVGAVPVTFHYQGHILVNGEAIDGEGNFKFSILRDAGTPNEAAVWSNDNPNGSAAEPGASVSLTLRRGIYSVGLGDNSMPNMASIPPAVFSLGNLSLRIWFSQGQGPYAQLSPDTTIGSVAFAMRAATVEQVEESALPESVSKIIALTEKMTFSSQDPADTDLNNAGYQVFRELDAASWEDGPEGGPAARSDHTGVWTGREFVVWGGSTSGSSLLGSGAKFDTLTGAWETVSTIDAPEARRRHRGVWMDAKMFIWGGHDGSGWNPVGGQYDPRIQKWFPVSAGPLLAREEHVMVWTGDLVLIWGGRHAQGRLGDGAHFSPLNNRWTSMPQEGAPVARSGASAVWTGGELIVWGGRTTRTEVGDGGRLTIPLGAPMSWQATSLIAAPSPRQGHTAVWTGNRMLVWGGNFGNELLDNGGSYDPQVDAWTRISRVDAPSARTNHSAVWTGEEMIILFGSDQDGETSSAHAYNPDTDTWRALPSEGKPSARAGATVVWTGREILAFGGEANGGTLGALQSIDPEPPVYLYRKP